MTQGQYNIYKADEGKFIYRKSDDFLFGEGICLGEGDSIDNYYEREYTEEEYKAYHTPPELPKDMLLKNISIKHNGSKKDIQ